MAFCPRCQHESSMRFFCDRCHVMLPSSRPGTVPRKITLPDDTVIDCGGFGGKFPADPFSYIKVDTPAGPFRVRAVSQEWLERLGSQLHARCDLELPVLAPTQMIPVSDGALLVSRGLPGAVRPLAGSPPADRDSLDDLLNDLRLLERAVTPLHEAGYVWFNFQPEGLLRSGDQLQIQDLDLILFAMGESNEWILPSPRYSPPEVSLPEPGKIGRATDVFHLATYAYYRLAGLLPGGFPGDGLQAMNYQVPPLRVYVPLLPPGLSPVLARGMADDPGDRHLRVDEFVADFADAVARYRSRCHSHQPVRWEWGAATAIGRSHLVHNIPNQDRHRCSPLPQQGLLAMVADGVTRSKIGSGEIASQLTIDVIEKTLPPLLGELLEEARRETALGQACLQASQAILSHALSLTDQPHRDIHGVDLMASTLVAAVMIGSDLTLANVGDSRAYLLTDQFVEQLTVDGDMQSVFLSSLRAPERLSELGDEAHTLFQCLGAPERAEDRTLVVCPLRCEPSLSHWKLVPGDCLILCSDGLVDEGVFLHPLELRDLLKAEVTPQAQAEHLVQAAVATHRDPSAEEPDGHGDDVTCIVIQVRAADASPGSSR